MKIIMIGATGAVGTEVIKNLVAMPEVEQITILGRRPLAAISSPKIEEHIVDPLAPESYRSLLQEYDTAICTLGVGEPTKVSFETFVRIDKTAVLDFASEVKNAGAAHFQLLCSVGANKNSRSRFLRTKGELEQGLMDMGFDRLSLFRPSMILTPTNRYGFTQAVTLFVWPLLTPILIGPLRKARGIRVEQLGKAIARNTVNKSAGVEILEWDSFIELASQTN